jgi:predicted DNA-binding protein with PD1-like motif
VSAVWRRAWRCAGHARKAAGRWRRDGDIASGDEGKASLHVHVVLGLSDGTTRGGHLLEGKVRPTLEVVLEETPTGLRRRKRPEFGIALIDLADVAKT